MAELNLPNSAVPCFTLHFGLVTMPADDIASDLVAACSQAADELHGACGAYARAAASLGEIYLKDAGHTAAAENVADAALKVCAAV